MKVLFSPGIKRKFCPGLRTSGAFLRQEDGDTLIEFAVSALTLIFILFTVFEVNLMMYTYVTLGDAAREGVRYAMVHGTDSSNCSGPDAGCGDSTGVKIVAAVKSVATAAFHDTSAMTITPSWPDGSAQPGNRVKVQLSYSYIPFVRIPWLFSPQMRLTSEGRIVF